MLKQVLLTEAELHEAMKRAVLAALDEREAKKPERQLSINQAAKILQLSWSTVRNLVKNGKLKTTGTGRILEKSLREFLDQHN
jgi:excisionase family DNA binding protein